jgi:hypothetical protein
MVEGGLEYLPDGRVEFFEASGHDARPRFGADEELVKLKHAVPPLCDGRRCKQPTNRVGL